MILDFNVCQDPGVLQTIYIIKLIIKVIFILVPIIIILTSIKSLTKAVMESDDNAIKNSVYLLMVKVFVGTFIFFVPTIFNAFFSVVENNMSKQSYASCYTNATLEKINYYKAQRKKELEEELENKREQNKNDKNNTSSNNGNDNKNNLGNTDQTNNDSQTNTKINKTIYIGDSRTVGMYFAMYGGSFRSSIDKNEGSEYWYASVGKGYSWFNSSAISYLKNKIKAGNYNVVILMGANDLYNSSLATSYVNSIRNLMNEYPFNNFIVVSVNPIDDVKSKGAGYSVNNNQVVNFNQNLKNSINNLNENVSYCDTYSQILNSFSTSDGLHYNNSTYKNIYNKINNCF